MLKSVKKWISLIMLLSILTVSCSFCQMVQAEYTSPAQDNSINIPYGSEISNYQPERDGYYGLLPLKRELEGLSDNKKQFDKIWVPALVKDDHLFIMHSVIFDALGLVTRRSGNTLSISAYKRNLLLTAGQSNAQFSVGETNNPYFRKKITLSAPPVIYNDMLWVPFQDICILFDLGLHQDNSESGELLTVYKPQENAVDVLSYLYSNSGECMTSYAKGNPVLLTGISAVAQISANLLRGDTQTYLAVIAALFQSSNTGAVILFNEFVDTLTDELMCVIPDESVLVSKKGADDTAKMIELYNEGFLTELSPEMIDLSIHSELSICSDLSVIMDAQLKNQLINKVVKLETLKEKINKTSKFYSIVSMGVDLFFGVVENALTHASVEDISRGGIDALLQYSSTLNDSKTETFNEMKKRKDFLQTNWIHYSLADYLMDNSVSIFVDAVASLPFKLIKLSTHLIPPIADGIDQTENYILSQIVIPLQLDTEALLLEKLAANPIHQVSDEAFRSLMEAAYIYLKTCYLAKNHAVTALHLKGNDLKDQEKQMEFLLEKMAVLSQDYYYPPENMDTKYQRIQQLDDSNLIQNYVYKTYINITGEVRNIANERAIEDAVCQIYNSGNELCGLFSGTPEGKYQNIFIPLYVPYGLVTYQNPYLLSAILDFSSPSHKGNDTKQITDITGSDVIIPETAYLGKDENTQVVAAGHISELNGTLFALPMCEASQVSEFNCLNTPDSNSMTCFTWYDNNLYYLMNQNIYRADADGKNPVQLGNGITVCAVPDSTAQIEYVTNDKIYIHTTGEFDYHFYSIDKNTGDISELFSGVYEMPM